MANASRIEDILFGILLSLALIGLGLAMCYISPVLGILLGVFALMGSLAIIITS